VTPTVGHWGRVNPRNGAHPRAVGRQREAFDRVKDALLREANGGFLATIAAKLKMGSASVDERR
jgi:hypothetical protein